MVYTGVAASEAILTDTERELGTILADIGGGTTSVIMFVDGSPVYSVVLPIGGKHVTNDLAIGLRAHMDAAERIKIKLSDERVGTPHLDVSAGNEEIDVSEYSLDTETIPKRFLYKIIETRLEEIFALIALEVKKANLTGKLPAGVVVTGGSAFTVGMERVAKNVLKSPVRIGYPKGVTGLIDEIEGPAFAATVGAVIYGSKLFKNKSGLSFDTQKGTIGNVLSKVLEKAKSFLP